MLTQLIADAQATATAAPAVVAAAAAITADLAAPSAVNLAQLSADAETLAGVATTLATAATALETDLSALPQATAMEGHIKRLKDSLDKAIADAKTLALNSPETTRLQNLICAGIPIYNIFAVLYGLPVLPLPAFCTTPTPTPAP